MARVEQGRGAGSGTQSVRVGLLALIVITLITVAMLSSRVTLAGDVQGTAGQFGSATGTKRARRQSTVFEDDAPPAVPPGGEDHDDEATTPSPRRRGAGRPTPTSRYVGRHDEGEEDSRVAAGDGGGGRKSPVEEAPSHVAVDDHEDSKSGDSMTSSSTNGREGPRFIRGGIEAPEAHIDNPDDFVALPSSGTTRKLYVPKERAKQHHVASAAEGASYVGPMKLAHEWKNPNLDEVTGASLKAIPKNGSYVCEFFLFGMPHICRIEQGEESMLDCIRRVGGRRLEAALPTRCTKTAYWQSVRDIGDDGAGEGGGGDDSQHRVGRDWVYNAQTAPDRQPQPYIPPHERTFRRDIQSRKCSYGTIHPITFTVPFRNIVPGVTRHKFFDFLPYGMRKFPPWQFKPGDYRMGHQDEFLTSLLHKHSYFAFTHKRGGWDCMRHTEILAAGTVPFFADLHLCGKYCLVLLPKQLLKEALELPGVSFIGTVGGGSHKPNQEFIEPIARATANMNFKKPGRIDWTKFDEDRYWDLADRIHNYTQHYLSTRSLVSYILHKVKHEQPKHAFVLGRDHMDFLELMIESGFADLGINYTTHLDRPTWHQVVEENGESYTAGEFEKIRDQRGLKSSMHGASMVVGLRTPPLQYSTRHDEIRQRIRNKEFDLVVYTWPHWPVSERGYPFWNDVKAHVPRDRIVFIDGGDDGADPHNDFRKAIEHGHIFRREMHDGAC